MKLSKARARIKAALAVLCGRGQEVFSEYAKRRAVDDFLRDAGLNIPGAWNPITSVEEYEEAAEKIERSRGRQALIQALRDKYTDKDGNVGGIKIGLVEQAAVALTVNGIKPPAELSDRLFQQYKRLFEHLARYLDEIKEVRPPAICRRLS